MGEYAELAIDKAMFGDPSGYSGSYDEYCYNKKIWVMKDGTEVKYNDMTDSHLLNSIKILERKNLTDMWAYMGLQNETERRKLSR